MEIFLINIFKAILTGFYMFWEVLWPLTLGFTLSAIVQAIVSKSSVAKTLGTDSSKSISFATLYGMASSSCSYAAVALARSIFRKGGSFANAMIFEIASTNLVIELGLILFILMGWQFTLAEFIGGIIMIVILAVIFHFTLKKNLIKQALHHANMGLVGRMEGHVSMDISETKGAVWQRIFSKEGITSISHYFVIDWVSIWQDLVLGFLLAGALAAWVPNSWWQTIFFNNNPTVAFIVGPLIGPIIAIITFVCSVGNVPLAAVFWRGGISFGGVISFIFADLIAIQILDIYRKYYGLKMSAYILITFYIAMVIAGYLVELLFNLFGFIPESHTVRQITQGIQWNYTTWLNIIFLIIGAFLVYRFIRTGGIAMLKMMNMPGRRDNKQHYHSL